MHFTTAYDIMKPQWIAEQQQNSHLDANHQQHIKDKQRGKLQQLIHQFNLPPDVYLIQFPVPILNDAASTNELLPIEDKLDETFRKEIGRIIPLLRESSIQGIEKYISTLEAALFSLAKNSTRQVTLDRLAFYYIPALIVNDRGLIKSYYNQFMSNRSLTDTPSLLETFRGIVLLMEADGHRACFGSSLKLLRQNNLSIGTYSMNFENYVLRTDGMRMDSAAMLFNVPLNNDRRRLFVNGLDSNLRIIVQQPAHDSTWHAFKQSYFDGFTRLYPNVLIFGKTIPPNSIHPTPRNSFRSSPYAHHNSKPIYRSKPTHNTHNHIKPFNPKPDKRLNKHNNTTKNNPRKPTKFVNTINHVYKELKRQSNLLSSLTSKLNLFDLPHTLTIVTSFTLITPILSWQCQQSPPFFPHSYHQFDYRLSTFKKLNISLMNELCIAVGFRPALFIGDVILDVDPPFPIETQVALFGFSECGAYSTYQNHTSQDIFLVDPTYQVLTDNDYSYLLNIYAYHYSFNHSCSSLWKLPLSYPESLVTQHGNNIKELQSSISESDAAKHNLTQQLNEAQVLYQQRDKELTNLLSFNQELQAEKTTLSNTLRSTQDDLRDKTEQLIEAKEETEHVRKLQDGSQNAMNAYRSTTQKEVTDLKQQHDDALALLRTSFNNEHAIAVQAAITHEQTKCAIQKKNDLAEWQRGIDRLEKDHANAIKLVTLDEQNKCIKQRNSDSNNWKKEADQIVKEHTEAVNSAILNEQNKCNDQRISDSSKWKKEYTRLEADFKLSFENERARLQSIFDKQLESLKTSLQCPTSDTMEVDNQSLLFTVTQQAQEILSLKQLLAMKHEPVAVQPDQPSPDLCRSYNDFVTFIENLKNLNINDAFLSVPKSIVSLITFISTLIGSHLFHNRYKFPTHNNNLVPHFTPTQVLPNYIRPQITPQWKFGDGPKPAIINSIIHEALPKILIYIYNIPVLSLIDTGASLNIINSNLLKSLPSSCFTKINSFSLKAKSANGTNIHIDGSIILNFSIADISTQITCHISPDISHDLILGKPGLSTMGDLTIFWTNDYILLGTHKLPLANTFRFLLNDDTTLNAESTNILSPRIHNATHLDRSDVFTIINPSFKGSNHLITYSQVNPIFNQQINLIIDNRGSNPVTLKKNIFLGHVA
uniref:Peptidase A2 domain-containing protein n=1 Tax=Strongyloides stercoralis TaxID=6248 RepID=A0AAF5DL72_STRER